jgi:uncharacterized protein (TIGR02266 family)
VKEAPPRQLPRARRVLINEEFAPVEAFINEYVANISLTGVFIKSRDPLPVGTRVNLKFSLILDELHVVEAAGEVVRRSQRPLGMGVAFRGLSPESSKLVSRAVKERIEQTTVTLTAGKGVKGAAR